MKDYSWLNGNKPKLVKRQELSHELIKLAKQKGWKISEYLGMALFTK